MFVHMEGSGADRKFTELFPLTNGVPTDVIAGNPPMRIPWSAVESMSDAQRARYDLYRVTPGEVPPGEQATRYHFVWRGDHVEQVVEESQPIPPPPGDALAIATLANGRIDAGIQAGLAGVTAAERLKKPKPRKARSTDDQLADLQAQIDALQEAMRAMLQAQIGRQPR